MKLSEAIQMLEDIKQEYQINRGFEGFDPEVEVSVASGDESVSTYSYEVSSIFYHILDNKVIIAVWG